MTCTMLGFNLCLIFTFLSAYEFMINQLNRSQYIMHMTDDGKSVDYQIIPQKRPHVESPRTQKQKKQEKKMIVPT